MGDFLKKLASAAWSNVEEGYYDRWLTVTSPHETPPSMASAIKSRRGRAVIAELKYRSPALGLLRELRGNHIEIGKAFVRGGATAVSVITEPRIFEGSMDALYDIARENLCPLLMKDVVVSRVQLRAARNAGASAVLLIMRLFDGGYCEAGLSEMCAEARVLGLEVLLETHGVEEFRRALELDVEMVGINNRNLDDLSVSLNVTREVLEQFRPAGKIVVSESGISSSEDVRCLRSLGVDAFLVGSSIMRADGIEDKVRELADVQNVGRV